MTTEMWIIAVVRIAGSLPVLRWPFYGGLLAVIIDLSDLFLMNLLSLGGVDDYQAFDKLLDQVYMATFLAVALRWQGPARSVSVVLFTYRLVGFAVFELTDERDILLLFPNFFEYWFLLVAGMVQFRRSPFATKPQSPLRHPEGGDGTCGWLGADGLRKEMPVRAISRPVLGILVAVLVALKLFQEYALHYGQWLDDFTAIEAVEAIWRFFTAPF